MHEIYGHCHSLFWCRHHLDLGSDWDGDALVEQVNADDLDALREERDVGELWTRDGWNDHGVSDCCHGVWLDDEDLPGVEEGGGSKWAVDGSGDGDGLGGSATTVWHLNGALLCGGEKSKLFTMTV